MDLNELLTYESEIGKLFWKKRHISMFAYNPQQHTSKRAYSAERACNIWNTKYAGKEAFTAINADGYRVGSRIDGRSALAHRIIWEMVTGDAPEMMDHINGDRADNRLCNLRPATPTLNSSNRGFTLRNKSGVMGVFWNSGRKCWQAQISMNGEQCYLGVFKTKDEAKAARKAAEIALKFVSRTEE